MNCTSTIPLIVAGLTLALLIPAQPAQNAGALTVPGFMQDKTVMVALGDVFDFLGYDISWDPIIDVVTFQRQAGILSVAVGKAQAEYQPRPNAAPQAVRLPARVNYHGRLLHGPLDALLRAARREYTKTRTSDQIAYTLANTRIDVRILPRQDKLVVDLTDRSVVKLETEKGPIYLELFERTTPVNAGNFLDLVQSGFYDGLTFHRVIADFMIQAGCPRGDGTGGPGFTIPDEADKGLKHIRGSLSMAKTPEPDTAGSQFFICRVRCDHLDGVHTVFGHCLRGMRAVDDMQEGDQIHSAEILWESEYADDAIQAARDARVPVTDNE